MKAINENAIYIAIGKILVDCHDIDKLAFMGYEPKKGTVNEPDKDKPVYRIIFKDGTYWENVLDRTALEIYNKFQETEVKVSVSS